MREDEILEGIRAHDRRALAKMLSICENDPNLANVILDKLEKKRSHVIGITGSPGVGKSTLINAILDKMNQGVGENVNSIKDMGTITNKKKIGVIVIDPSSPFTGGALLGDRVRMQSHATEEDFFIRSFANRGALGGLSPSIYEACDAFEAFGMDNVIIETVGVGQSEVEITNIADTVVVVLSPDNGDEVQMLKAGLMEIADLFVINKADNPRSQILLSRLRKMMITGDKDVGICLTNAVTGEGVEKLIKELDDRFFQILSNGVFSLKRKKRLLHHAQSIVRRELDELIQKFENDGTELKEIEKRLLEELCRKAHKNGS